MRFGAVSVGEAEGAVAVHSIRKGGVVLKKGTLIGKAEIAALKSVGIAEIVVARIEPGDVSEDTAAAEIAGPQGAGGALGFQNTAMYLAGAWSPLAFGALVSILDWRSGFVALSVAAAAGWLVSRALVAEETSGWKPAAA